MTSPTLTSPPRAVEPAPGPCSPAVWNDVCTLTAGDGLPLALHRWTRTGNHAVLFYLHGIQSHAGWLFETGPELALRGVDTYVLDRRGSGSSGGPRGHLCSAQQVLDDYAQALGRVAGAAGSRPLVAVGQSLGGSVLAALWATSNLPGVRRLVFCAPALGQQRLRHSPEALHALRAGAGEDRHLLTFDDADYTSLSRYSAFMANDHLMVRQVTASTLATLVRIEDVYTNGARPTPMPVTLVRPERDPIIDLGVADVALRSLSPGPVQVQRFDADRHYLEFSVARSAYWDWLAATVTARSGPVELAS